MGIHFTLNHKTWEHVCHVAITKRLLRLSLLPNVTQLTTYCCDWVCLMKAWVEVIVCSHTQPGTQKWNKMPRKLLMSKGYYQKWVGKTDMFSLVQLLYNWSCYHWPNLCTWHVLCFLLTGHMASSVLCRHTYAYSSAITSEHQALKIILVQLEFHAHWTLYFTFHQHYLASSKGERYWIIQIR
jgi:hypothetical protein